MLTIAIVCLGVVLYRAGATSISPGELSPVGDPATTAAPPPTPVVYQEAVKLCAHTDMVDGHTHWCGTLADAPGFNDPPTIATAAREGMDEFANPSLGAGLGNSGEAGPLDWRWNYQIGLWGAHMLPHWWQSALALRTVIWYAQVTKSTDPSVQTILQRTYQRESGLVPGEPPPFAIAKTNFTNLFMDDTAWWGLAWLEASGYELDALHDGADASKFLAVAKYDAQYIAASRRSCGGVEWQIGNPTDTITNAEYVTLTAELASYLDAPGPFYDPSAAAGWLTRAESQMNWLEHSGLINMKTGEVNDRLSASCKRIIGGPTTYTEGQVADAFVQLGLATHDSSYYGKAALFLHYVLSKASGMDSNGVLEEPCERSRYGCTGTFRYLDLVSYKGVLMRAFSDYTTATGATAPANKQFVRFQRRQASAVVHNAIIQPNGQPGNCNVAANCQFVFYWAWPVSPVRSELVDQGTQMSALNALIADLALPPPAAQHST